MKTPIRNIILKIMTVVILFATTGLPVFSHHCLSNNLHEASLFTIEKCKDKLKKDACCNVMAIQLKAIEDKHTEGDCCDYDADYVSMDADWSASKVNDLFILPNIALYLPSIKLPQFIYDCEPPISFSCIDLPPPKLEQNPHSLLQSFLL